jgi:hypothetical protein
MRRTLVCVVLLVTGCGGAVEARQQGMHDVLDVLTDTVDPAYGFAVAACDARADVIVDRTGTTEEQDQRDYAAVRAKCDRAFAIFERIREAQAAARAAVDSEQFAQAIHALALAQSQWAQLGGWDAPDVRP